MIVPFGHKRLDEVFINFSTYVFKLIIGKDSIHCRKIFKMFILFDQKNFQF